MRIALCGPIGAGKSTAAEWVARRYSIPRFSFADPVREIAALRHSQPERSLGQLFAWVDRNLPHWPVERQEHLVYELLDAFWSTPLEPAGKQRKLLVAVGQTGRRVDSNLWIDLLLRRVGDGPAVVDDCRFENEARALRRHGFLIVRIFVPTDIRRIRVLMRDHAWDEQADQDSSEAEWAGIQADAELRNDGGLDELYRKLEYVLLGRFSSLALHAM